ncbi:aspartate aminotransferase, mitochondrial-like [Epargyreus clarus]|uniref:aspartate aminotransferase, mitochondrial-like n=1 Tax=Epargyreus clarus TaxID=520877 RepID=UPI003C301F04
MSQVKYHGVRTTYSNPPLYGARLVQKILTAPDLRKQWLPDVKLMVDRISAMRTQLHADNESAGNKNWGHIADHIGTFCFTGLNREDKKAAIFTLSVDKNCSAGAGEVTYKPYLGFATENQTPAKTRRDAPFLPHS